MERPTARGAADVFDDGRKEDATPSVDVKSLHAKIGELTLENDFLAGALGKAYDGISSHSAALSL